MHQHRSARLSPALAAPVLVLLFGLLPWAEAAAGASPTISSLSVSGSPFAAALPPLPTEATITLKLSRPAKTMVTIRRPNGRLVKTLAGGARLAAGAHSWSWAGRRAGALVADGVYLVRVVTENAAGKEKAERRLRKGLPPIYAANPGALVVAVDPGHGGRYPGACHRGSCEKDFNLDIGLKLGALLEHAGVQVVMSRTTDNALDEPPTDWNGDGLYNRYDDDLLRVDNKNLARADVAVHVHNNGSTNASAHGTAVYTDAHQTWTPQATELAQSIVDEEVAILQSYASPQFTPKQNGVRFGWYYYMGPYDPPFLPRSAMMASVLSESLFVTNDAELEALRRSEIRTSLAAAIYIGLAKWLNTRKLGIGYELVSGPGSSVAAGSPAAYTIRVTNRGNAATSGWRFQLRNVPFVPVYDGSGQLGTLMGSVAVPDGLQPGASVDVTVNATAPASPGDWWVKTDVRMADDSYASTAGVVSLQLPLTTN